MSSCTCACSHTCNVHSVHTYLLLSLPVEWAKLPLQQVVEAEEVSHLTIAVQETAEGWNSLIRNICTRKDTGVRLFPTLKEALAPNEGGWSHIQPLLKLVNTTLYSNVQEYNFK